MMLGRRDVLAAGAAVAAVTPFGAVARPKPALPDIAARLQRAGVPGLATATVHRGRIASAEAGMADVARARSVTSETVFHLASVSKVVTGTALMRLYQDGKFALDQDVRPLLDFPLVHPRFPDAPISFRHLFQHRSGIAEGSYGPKFFGEGDSPVALRDFLTAYLVKGGKYYSETGSWSPDPPGAHWAYSNVAIALAGYLAERLGAPLDDWSRRRIFAPLAMTSAAWQIRRVAGDRLAIPYSPLAAGGFRPLPQVGFPDWPSGMLRATARDMARFLTIFTDPKGPGRHVLSPPTIATMMAAEVFPGFTATLDGQALFWRRTHIADRPIIFHTGSDPGANTGVYIDPARGTGAVILMNGDSTTAAKALRSELARELLEQAALLG